MEQIDTVRVPIAVLNERRRRAVKLREQGMTLREVAAAVEISIPTVMAAHRAYLAGGWPAVNVGRRGRRPGSGRRLSRAQESRLRKLICDKTPDQYKMDFALWSRQAVAQLVRDQFGIDLPVRTMGDYLARWGFTPQKPIRRAYEQRPADVQRWLDEEYPAIAARARSEGAEIHWGDETGLRSDDVRGRSYAPRGETPVVRVNARRQGLSVISTVTNRGTVRWRVFDGALNADLLIDFFGRLIKDNPQKIFLILDNLKVHHAKVVRAWLAEHADAIEVFYLPSYSPELNPDEMLNADLKAHVTRRAAARTRQRLRQLAISHLRHLQRSPERVRSFFGHRTVNYAS